jgi:hypothetical protein
MSDTELLDWMGRYGFGCWHEARTQKWVSMAGPNFASPRAALLAATEHVRALRLPERVPTAVSHAEAASITGMLTAGPSVVVPNPDGSPTSSIPTGLPLKVTEVDAGRGTITVTSTQVSPDEQDRARMDWLEAQGVESIYLRDGRQINPASMNLRAAIDALPAARVQP